MSSVLVLVHGSLAERFSASELKGAGLQVAEELTECHKLVQAVAQQVPEVVLVQALTVDDKLLAALHALGGTASLPVVLFTPDADAARMAKALQAGVHAWVPGLQAPADWGALLQLARLRHAHEQGLLTKWRDATDKLEERKTVERAKGLLMRGRDVTDDDAFRILRNASMHTNQRISQVSQHIIEVAHCAEAVNRAGQLRMLSQRLVKLHLLRLAEPSARTHKQAFEESVKRVDDNLLWLAQTGSVSGSGPAGASAGTDEALVAISVAWLPLKTMLQACAAPDSLPQVEERAERFLQQAEALTGVLERDGQVATLKVLNVAGRQRMLSQRFAKLALVHLLQLPVLESDGRAAMTLVQIDFEQALAYLNALPLTTTPIRAALDAAQSDWQHMLATVAGVGRVSGRDLSARLHVVANASEALLAGFEQLSTQYERSMHMLMG